MQNPAVANKYAAEASEIVRELVHSLTLENDPVTRFKGQLGSRKKVKEYLDFISSRAKSKPK